MNWKKIYLNIKIQPNLHEQGKKINDQGQALSDSAAGYMEKIMEKWCIRECLPLN
jgi:hypothetical protein